MLSIIIPTYNEAQYLPRLLYSIKRQTFKNYEIIVADANSSDNTRAVAESVGCRVVSGGSPSEGRNYGAGVASGSIFLFLDADVVLASPYFLEKTIKEFERKKLGVATCRIKPLSDKKVDKFFHDFYNKYSRITRPVRAHAPGFCIFARKDVHQMIGGFDEGIKLAEDQDYVVRATKQGSFRILKSASLYVSVRRFNRDGRFNVAVKYLFCELYMLTGGRIRSDIFNYTFGHKE
ncbi:MAG: glycosyltransferase [Patescibacteria group bacterium]|nr:glycosyltransferase [Patescibacteria group bacterium]